MDGAKTLLLLLLVLLFQRSIGYFSSFKQFDLFGRHLCQSDRTDPGESSRDIHVRLVIPSWSGFLFWRRIFSNF